MDLFIETDKIELLPDSLTQSELAALKPLIVS